MSLTFHAASPQAAEAWENAFAGAAARNGLIRHDHRHQSGNTAWINITGSSHRGSENDVLLEVLVANYTMSLENVPTMIE